MTPGRSLAAANALALLMPAALLGGAYAFQYLGGLPPCEMCWWQRWPHMAAVAIALTAIMISATRVKQALVALAAVAIAISGAIGVFHAGIEQKWWHGITACSAAPVAGSTEQILAEVMATPLIRCDAIPWSLFGVSLAGWNAILSLASAALIIWLMRKS